MRRLIALLPAIIMTVLTVIAINFVVAQVLSNLYNEANLMFGTSPQSPSKYKISDNIQYTILGLDGDFVFLRIEGKTNPVYGYVNKRYFENLTVNDLQLPYTAQNGMVVNVKNNLNFRFTASAKEDNIIGTIKNSQEIKVLFEENGFYYVEATLNQPTVSARGFVSKKYIKLL